MYGVVEGLMRCQEGRVEDLNKRIASRNQPGGYLQSTFPHALFRLDMLKCQQ